jgi:hypothetical protein
MIGTAEELFFFLEEELPDPSGDPPGHHTYPVGVFAQVA